jgi:acryloyl-coenzyme A reductase
MKASVFHEFGGPEVLRYEEVPTPEPGPGDVLLAVEAVTINRGPDTGVRRDGFGIPGFALPHVSGADPAGRVMAIGAGVTGWKEGRRAVVYPLQWCGECDFCRAGASENYCRSWRMLGMHMWGGHAEYVTVPARTLVALPDGVSFEQAATLPVSYITAYHGLTGQVGVTASDTVLVMAAGSGIGVAAIQVARHLGARVIATTGEQWKQERALALGAEAVFDYRDPDWPAQVRAASPGGRGVTVAFDNIGEETWSQSLSCLDRGGRMLCSGNTAGGSVALDLRTAYRKMITMRFHMQGGLADLQALVDLVAVDALSPVVDRTFPLSAAAQGDSHLAARGQFGKVVLIPDARYG